MLYTIKAEVKNSDKKIYIDNVPFCNLAFEIKIINFKNEIKKIIIERKEKQL